jgi:hypothetical protein
MRPPQALARWVRLQEGRNKTVKRIARVPSQLSDSLHKHVGAYALAASAAGVGVMALAQPAEAEIIYTPAHQKISPSSVLSLDLNHDGIVDFTLNDINTFYMGKLSVLPGAGSKNQIWEREGNSQWPFLASALLAGVRVGPKVRQFLRVPEVMAWTHFSGGGIYCFTGGFPWGNVRNRYLGLKYAIDGKVHFGWARLNVSCPWDTFTVTGLLTGYAYETIPNKPIITGKTKGRDVVTVRPATLWHLAAGASAIPAWRRAGANK